MMLAETQPKANCRLNVPVWCKFWCKSLAHVIHLTTVDRHFLDTANDLARPFMLLSHNRNTKP